MTGFQQDADPPSIEGDFFPETSNSPRRIDYWQFGDPIQLTKTDGSGLCRPVELPEAYCLRPPFCENCSEVRELVLNGRAATSVDIARTSPLMLGVEPHWVPVTSEAAAGVGETPMRIIARSRSICSRRMCPTTWDSTIRGRRWRWAVQ